jgi:hypothetical protein
VTTRPEPVADVAFAWLVGLLALPWLLHAQLVLASSLGFTPLASRIASWAMIVAAVAGAMLLGHFGRSRGARMPQPPSAAEGAAPRVLRALPIAGGVAVLYPLVTAALLPIIAYDAVAIACRRSHSGWTPAASPGLRATIRCATVTRSAKKPWPR